MNFEAMLDDLADRIADRIAARSKAGSERKPNKRLFSVQEAAEYLGRSPAAVRHLINAGKLPTVRLDNRISLDRQDLDRVIAACKEPAVKVSL